MKSRRYRFKTRTGNILKRFRSGTGGCYICSMNDAELIAYFDNRALPEILRLDRATTQHEVADAVKRNIENIKADPNDHRSRHRLARIMEAIEKPYDGPAIPKVF